MGVKSLIAIICTFVIALCIGVYVVWQKEAVVEVIEEDTERQLVIAQWYGLLHPMTIGSTVVQASIADTTETRTKGLSGTPYLPEGVVKLFVFDVSDRWGFWMKDMNYAIDIMWVDAAGEIIHIEENVAPSSFPKSYTPATPALYVIEASAGFVQQYEIAVGENVTLPESVQQ